VSTLPRGAATATDGCPQRGPFVMGAAGDPQPQTVELSSRARRGKHNVKEELVAGKVLINLWRPDLRIRACVTVAFFGGRRRP